MHVTGCRGPRSTDSARRFRPPADSDLPFRRHDGEPRIRQAGHFSRQSIAARPPPDTVAAGGASGTGSGPGTAGSAARPGAVVAGDANGTGFEPDSQISREDPGLREDRGDSRTPKAPTSPDPPRSLRPATQQGAPRHCTRKNGHRGTRGALAWIMCCGSMAQWPATSGCATGAKFITWRPDYSPAPCWCGPRQRGITACCQRTANPRDRAWRSSDRLFSQISASRR